MCHKELESLVERIDVVADAQLFVESGHVIERRARAS